MKHALILVLALTASPAIAEIETDADDAGTLNPEEMTLNRTMQNIANGQTDMVTCATGYLITKSGRHEMARTLFTRCAEAGYAGAMTWMGQLENNGLGAPEDPDAAANWDRMAAETGDPVGQFNYGIDLMRGHGVGQDQAAGRALVDQAAQAGLPAAQRLRAAGYDLDEATPDADNWKYAPLY